MFRFKKSVWIRCLFIAIVIGIFIFPGPVNASSDTYTNSAGRKFNST